MWKMFHFSIFMKPYKSPDNFQNTMLTTDLFGPYFTNYISKESVMATQSCVQSLLCMEISPFEVDS